MSIAYHFRLFDPKISSLNPKLIQSMSLEMNQSLIERGSSSYVGWIRDMIVYDNSLSPK
jgi:hypothetical protein